MRPVSDLRERDVPKGFKPAPPAAPSGVVVKMGCPDQQSFGVVRTGADWALLMKTGDASAAKQAG